VPGLEGATANDLSRRVTTLDADAYMIATREMLQVAVWLKRAVQATFEGT
jgi:CRISPR-associated protein Cmr5